MPDTANAVRPVRLFVSHHSSKLDVALHVEKALALHGISCWIAPRDVDPGEPFDREIQNAIDGCSAVLLLFCSNSDKRRHVKRELSLADTARKAIMPLRLEAVDPKELAYHLADSQWIDWLEHRDETIRRIAAKTQQFHKAGLPETPGNGALAQTMQPRDVPKPAPEPVARPAFAAAPLSPPVSAQPGTPEPFAAREKRPTPMLGGMPLWLWFIGGGLALLIVIALAFAPEQSDLAADSPDDATSDESGYQDSSTLTRREGSADPPIPTQEPLDINPSKNATSSPSFDCSKATLRVEKMVCASDELAALDRALAASFQKAVAAAGVGGGAVREDQMEWINQVNSTCTDPQCVGQALRDRAQVLDAVSVMSGSYGL